jgi:serine/threonine protein kinase
MRKLVHGIKDIWRLNIIHRDMKLANILLHFPDNPELGGLNKNEKRAWLQKVDLRATNFEAKISDFGLSTILEGPTQQLSICGTPLYSSP